MFTFTPLLGAQSPSTASQSLLEVDGGVKILVDVGWDENFDAAQLQALENHVSSLSLILLTHATIDHIGAYAHCCKHIPQFSQVPVYATTPVINLGRTLLLDLYASAPLAASILQSPLTNAVSDSTSPPAQILLQPPTANEIASYFSHIHPLKYSQPHQPLPSPFSQPLGNLLITAYSAGHTLGGTIWHIQHGLESIIYAADWNQGRENLLSGAAWLAAGGGAEIIEPLRRPTALVCSSKGVERTDTLPRKKRDEVLISTIRDAIAQGGKVLIPTDSSARVLELALILNQTWHESMDGPHADTFRGARIYMASRTCSSTVRQVQSMLEWMDETIIRDVEASMNRDKGDERTSNLLEWRYIKQIERKSHFEKILRRSTPCVILASDATLEWGFSRQALEAMAADARNVVLLTDVLSKSKLSSRSPAGQLQKIWHDRTEGKAAGAEAGVVLADGSTVTLRDSQILSLNEDENLLYQQYIARQRHMHGTAQGDNAVHDNTTTEIADDQASESSESEDEDDDGERQGRALILSAQMTQTNKRKIGLSDAELGINILLRSKNVHDFDVRNKRGREKVFPFVLHKAKSDEYGDAIKPEDYLRAEERDDVNGVDMRDGNKPEPAAVGQKRKWDEANTHNSSRTKGHRDQKVTLPKRPQVERKPDDIDALIARATGANEVDDLNEGGSESDDESEYEPEEDDTGGPQKIEFTSRELALHLQIVHINFSGLHDRRDLQMLIPLIQPRKLVLIAGDESETQTLAGECRQLLHGDETSADVFTPLIGETVDASVDTNAWTLKLSRQMVKKLIWQNVKGLGIVALTGRLTNQDPTASSEDDDQTKKKAKLSGDVDTAAPADSNTNDTTSMPVLDLITTGSQLSAAGGTHQRPTQPVHVGDLRLADLRRLMSSSGHTAEFRGEGTLLIDGTVVVRKSTTGKIEIEAGAGGLVLPKYRTKENEGSFYAVRKLIYGGLAVVAGV